MSFAPFSFVIGAHLQYFGTGETLMSYKVGMVSLGCPKNQVDAELMLHRIASCSDMELCSDENEADAVIINTCGFIESAKAEAINTILEFCESKKQTGRPAAVIATGCLSERYREEMLREIPELDGVSLKSRRSANSEKRPTCAWKAADC